MKKLLSLLSVTTLATSVPAPLLANTVQTRVKRDVSALTSKSNNDYLPLKEINGIGKSIFYPAVDSKDNIYFGTSDGLFVLKQGATTPTKIDGIKDNISSLAIDSKDNIFIATNKGLYKLSAGSTAPTKIDGMSYNMYSIAIDSKDNIYFIKANGEGLFKIIVGSDTTTKINEITDKVNIITVDSKDNIYFGTSDGLFVLKQGATTPTKINGINEKIITIKTDSKDNIYYVISGSDGFAFVLKQGSTTPIKIDGISSVISLAIDSKDNVYFGSVFYNFSILKTALSWVKQQSQFNLVDSSKNIVWLRDDQLVVNGQVKVKIANTDIETVKVNDKEMPQTNKVWEFDLPTASTTVENKDYKIEIAFKLDGKSYTEQIIVSSLLLQPSINVKKNTSVIGNVDNYVYQVLTNDKVSDITLTSDLYYSDTEVKVSLNKPTSNTTIIAQIFGLDEKWEKNRNVYQIFDNQTYNLDGSQLNSYQGRYLIDTEDNAKNKSSYYVIINKDNLIPNFWDTEQGQIFYSWANLNGYNESIKKLNATELNKIINKSKNWQQLASDSQFARAVADWFKTNGKLSSKEPLTKEQVVERLKTQIPSSITIDKLNTSNYDINKVSFELNKSEFKPNDKVNITVKYNSATSEQFTLQIKDSKTPDNNKKGGLSGWAIVGIVLGSLAGLALLGWLLKRFVIDPFILNPIRDKKQKAWRIREDKALAEMQAEKEAEKAKRGK